MPSLSGLCAYQSHYLPKISLVLSVKLVIEHERHGVGGPAVPLDQVSPGHAILGSYVPPGLLSLGPNVLFDGSPHVYSTVHCAYVACARSIDWQAPNGILVAMLTNKLTLRDKIGRGRGGGAHLSYFPLQTACYHASTVWYLGMR